jgi:ABC-type sugar transport system substrate-binding protein
MLSSKCPDCKVTYNEIQPKDLGSPAATNAMVSKLQADPSIKYAYTIIGNVAAGLTTALSQANITGVKIFGQVPDENAIKALRTVRMPGG